MEVRLKQVPDETWELIKDAARHHKVNINDLVIDIITAYTEKFKKDESKRLVARLDELKQKKLIP